MERYKAVVDELILMIRNPDRAQKENQTIKAKDMKLLEKAVDDKSTDTEKIMLMVQDVITLSEESAYIRGIADGLRLKV